MEDGYLPTARLRWKKIELFDKAVAVECRWQLQQLWTPAIGFTGEDQWRDVEVVEEEEKE